MNFYYWDNSEKWHGKLLLVVPLPPGSKLSEADAIFEEKTGINPVKNSKISCSWD